MSTARTRLSGTKTRIEPLIDRVDYNYFNGYTVQIKRGGDRINEYFSDKPNGRRAALARARRYRDDLVALLPPPAKIKRRYVRNTTGVIGVALVHERTRSGNLVWRYRVSWPLRDGGTERATFSVPKYGKQEARRRAIAARKAGLAKLMAPGPARAYQKRSTPKSSKI